MKRPVKRPLVKVILSGDADAVLSLHKSEATHVNKAHLLCRLWFRVSHEALLHKELLHKV